jgi:integrase
MPRPPKKTPKAPNGTGSVRPDKRRPGKWRVMVSLPDGSRRTATASSHAEGIEIRNELLARSAAGEIVSSATATLTSQVAYWRDNGLRSKRLAPATVEQYEWALSIVDAKLGRAKLKTLSVEQVERFLSGLAADGYSRNSIRLVRNALSQVLSDVERRGHVTRNVARLAHLPADAIEAAERRALSDDEFSRLISAAAGDRLEALWVLALSTGARRGELLGLAWSSVDLEERTITVTEALRRNELGGYSIGPTKTRDSERVVQLGQSTVKALRGHQKRQKEERLAAGERWRDSGLVFTTTIGTHLDPGRLRRAWDDLCERAGVEGVVFHELRHTVGSHAIDSDVPLAVVADQLGHSVDVLVRTYRHRTKPAAEGVADVMEGLIAPSKRSRRR